MYVEWPDGKKFVLCLTHDVDRVKKTYQYITHFVRTRKVCHLTSIFHKKEPFWNFEELIKVEKKYKVKSTFFFLNETKKLNILNIKEWPLSLGYYNIFHPKISKVIKKLYKRGWEIGVHGSYDSFKDEKLLSKEKKDLEEIVGEEIVGIRQHLLNLQIPLTWKLQMKVGFKYDSSFGYSSRFGNKVGFRDNKYLPFFPFKNKKFLVIPIAIMDNILLKYKKKDMWEECKKMIDISEKNNGVLTILWHQEIFNEKLFPELVNIYKKIIEECKNRDAWIAKCIDIFEWLS